MESNKVIILLLGFIFISHIQAMTTFKVEPVAASPLSVLGEGPHWDVETQSLYYVDIYNNKTSVLRYDYAENKTYSAIIDNEQYPSFIIPVDGQRNQFAVGLMRRVVIIEWDGKSSNTKIIRVALEVEKEDAFVNNRFNDAKTDPTGRFYGGTMRREECGDIFGAADGALYKYAKDESVKTLVNKIGVSNGLAWNEMKRKFYYIDSCEMNVREYDWNPKCGDISNERVLINFHTGKDRPTFVPDGMTIDADGNLYVATFGGSKIIKVDTNTGKIEFEIPIPAEQITSAAFGGPNLDILYVTSAGMDMYKKQPPLGGSLFQVTGLGVKGVPAKKVRL